MASKSKGVFLTKRWTLALLSIVAMMILPLGLEGEPYVLHLLIIVFIYSIVAVNWNLIMGYAGIFSLGQLSFFAIGGYTSGILSVDLGVSPWAAMFIGAVVASVAGLVIGLPVLRLQGIYVAFVTIAFQEALRLSILNEYQITGGSIGFINIPPLALRGTFDKIDYYYFSFILLTLVAFIAYRILKSRLGLAMFAIRDSEIYATGRGVSIYTTKLLIFAISAFFTGLAGAVYAHYLAVIAPDSAGLPLVIVFELILILGGLGSFSGPFIGTIVYFFLTEYLRIIEMWRDVTIPLLVILLVIFLPSGLASLPELARFWVVRLRKSTT